MSATAAPAATLVGERTSHSVVGNFNCRGAEKSLGGVGSGSSKSCPLSHPDDFRNLSPLLCFIRSDLVQAFVVTTDEEARACRNVDCRRTKERNTPQEKDNNDGGGVAAEGSSASSHVRRTGGGEGGGGGGEWDGFYGRVGVRCVYCALAASNSKSSSLSPSSSSSKGQPPKKARGAARGAVSFPPTVRLVYQSVRNWQRYHVATCPSMPDNVKAKYLSLKAAVALNTKEKSRAGVGSYWEKSCAWIGMVNAEDGIRLRDGKFLWEPAKKSVVGTLPCKVMESMHLGSTTDSEGKEDTVMMAADIASHDTLCNAPTSCEQHVKDQHHPPHAEEVESNQWMENSSLNRPFLPQSMLNPLSSSGTSPPAPSSNGAIVAKVKLAERIVRAMGEVDREFDWSGGESEGLDDSFTDMRHRLGEELYELFAERNPFPEEEEGDDDEEDCLDEAEKEESSTNINEGLMLEAEEDEEGGLHQPRQPKREKKWGEDGRGRAFVPLGEMGLPPPLCFLVSALLDTSDSEGFLHSNPYACVQDVEEDLRLMAERPDRFLFPAGAPGSLQTASTLLFGREGEVSRLLEAYDATVHDASGVGRNSMVLVAGFSGTGKSVLVYNVRDRLVDRGARFVSGKFDAMRQTGPLMPIVSAVDSYCDMLAHEPPDRIDHVREAIASAIGEEGTAALACLIPNLGKIVETAAVDGPPPAGMIPAVGGEATGRLVFLFRMLLRATCSRAHPVVLFLDDLQWADEMSLELMRALVVDVGIEGLLVIGCYRDNEVDANHLLTLYLDNIIMMSQSSVDIIYIQVGNLDLESVNALVSEVLCLTPRTTRLLAEVVLHKTSGNALFVVQFLGSLRDEGLLRFSLMSRRWEWDIDKIRCKSIADDVVELMTTKLLRLDSEVQQALKILAALGAQCEEEMFHILDRAPDRVVGSSSSSVAALDVAVTEGLVIKARSEYRFSHDQIQHAAYLLIPELDGEGFHLMVGRWLWQWSSAEEMGAYLFVVVDQLHRGSRLITDHDEQIDLARLSLSAGRKALGMYAFRPAETYLRAGIGLLSEEDWFVHRDLCFDLYNSAAETEYILREFDVMELHWDEVLRRADTLQEKLRAYYALVQSHAGRGNARDSIGTAMEVLRQLGEPFPEAVTKVSVMQEMIATQKLITQKTEDALYHLEVMTDGRKREAMKFLDLLIFALLLLRHEYFPLVACRMVRLSLEYGVCSESVFGFACYGIVLVGPWKDLAGGYRFGRLALWMQNKFPDEENLARVHLFVYGFINNWVEPIQSSLPFLKDSIQVGLAAGNIQCGTAATVLYLSSALFAGESLVPLSEEMKSLSMLMPKYQLHAPQAMSKPIQRAVMILLGQSDNPIKLIRDENDEYDALKNNSEDDIGSQLSLPDALSKLCRMWLEYLFGEYELAWETREENRGIEELGGAISRFPAAWNYCFFSGLTAIAMARKEGESKYADTIDRTLVQMDVWAASTSWNCQHKLELMKAEYAYLKRDFARAAETYSTAVESAAKHKFIHEEALASERAGVFYSETGDHDAASEMFKRAHNCYNGWGARSKAAHVQQQYNLSFA